MPFSFERLSRSRAANRRFNNKKKILEHSRMVEMTENGTAKGNNFKGNLNWKIISVLKPMKDIKDGMIWVCIIIQAQAHSIVELVLVL